MALFLEAIDTKIEAAYRIRRCNKVPISEEVSIFLYIYNNLATSGFPLGPNLQRSNGKTLCPVGEVSVR